MIACPSAHAGSSSASQYIIDNHGCDDTVRGALHEDSIGPDAVTNAVSAMEDDRGEEEQAR